MSDTGTIEKGGRSSSDSTSNHGGFPHFEVYQRPQGFKGYYSHPVTQVRTHDCFASNSAILCALGVLDGFRLLHVSW